MEYGKACQLVLDECRQALGKVDEGQVKEFISLVYSSEKVFFIGVGRVLLSLEAFAKRLAHLGIDAVVVGEITEPAFTDKDLLVVGSGSGESLFPVAIAKKAKSIGGKVVHIGSNENSSMKEVTDLKDSSKDKIIQRRRNFIRAADVKFVRTGTSIVWR